MFLDISDGIIKDIFLLRIADGLCFVANMIGASIPTGGGALSVGVKIISTLLKEHKYNQFADRMALITDDRDILDLADLSRQIARQLADRYEEQLLQLDPNKIPQVCFPCFEKLRIRCKKEKKDEPSNKPKIIGRKHPAKRVAQFGVAFAIQSIIEKKSDEINIYEDMKTEDLAMSIVQLICCAKPNIKSKVLRRMNLDKKMILPYEPLRNGGKWYLHDFYHKPGIYTQTEEKRINQKPLSWMNPDIYGYRFGTDEEYDNLVKLDKNQIEKKSKCCCCSSSCCC
jgi:hypothetical protein